MSKILSLSGEEHYASLLETAKATWGNEYVEVDPEDGESDERSVFQVSVMLELTRCAIIEVRTEKIVKGEKMFYSVFEQSHFVPEYMLELWDEYKLFAKEFGLRPSIIEFVKVFRRSGPDEFLMDLHAQRAERLLLQELK